MSTRFAPAMLTCAVNITVIVAFTAVCVIASPDVVTSDVVVYGANAAGVITAVAAARHGAHVTLLCQAWPDCWAPSRRVGGLTTGGLGTTDSCRQSADEPFDLCQLAITGGLAEEFYSRSAAHYGCHNCTAASGCQGCNATLADRQMPYNVEPSVALSVLTTMIAAEAPNLQVYYETQVATVDKNGSRITTITMDDGQSFAGSVFVDSSYEGDLFARAGVEFTVGRESPKQYNESLNGRLLGEPKNANNFRGVVNPYGDDGKPLPGIMADQDAVANAGVPGQADRHVQAYNFRLCVTQQPDNMIPFPKPAEYHPEDFELLARTCAALGCTAPSCNTQPIPNFKFDNNNCGPVSTDLVTADYTNASWRNLTSWRYPEADYDTRREIWRVHQMWQQGVLWTLGHDERIPESVRSEMAGWGLCKDEFTESDGWPPTMYVREARRMVGERVLTEADVREGGTADIGNASLGLAAHAEDSHNNQRLACRNSTTPPCYGDKPNSASTSTAYAWNEGDFHSVESGHVYQLPAFLVLPKEDQASNLLVSVAPSASHIAFSTFRMEPAYMVLGHSVGVWAALAATSIKGAVREVSLTTLHQALEKDGQVLRIPAYIPPAGPPHNHSGRGYSCTNGFNRCLAVSNCKGSCSNTSYCANVCSSLEPQQWLALNGANGGFQMVKAPSGPALKALSSKSYLKKSEDHSSVLPDSMKRLVAEGSLIPIFETAPPMHDGYFLVTLKNL